MNFLLKQLMLRHRLMDENNGDGNDLPGGQGDEGQGNEGQGEQKPTGKGVSDEEARLLKENMKRKEELRKKEEEIAALKKRFDGIDPEAVRKLLDEQKSAETKALEAKGDYDRLKQRMAEEHVREVKTLQEQIDQLTSQLTGANSTINELTVGTQFGQSAFIAGELTLTPTKARVIYGEFFDVEGGSVVGYDKPRGAANRTALVDQYGSAIPFDQALRKIVESDPEKDHVLKAKIRPGAGSESKRSGTEGARQETGDDSVSKIAAGLKGLKLN